MASTIELPRPTDDTAGTNSGDYCIVVFNNERNTFAEVISILMVALGINAERAELFAWDIHLRGEAQVYYSSMEDCEQRASVISKIGIRTEVRDA